MLVPRMVLTPPKHGGRAGNQEIHHLCQKFLKYCWKELLQLNVPRLRKETIKRMLLFDSYAVVSCTVQLEFFAAKD
jgi:hypothetical protein